MEAPLGVNATDVLPGSVAWSLVGATWAWLLATLLGASAWRVIGSADLGLSPQAFPASARLTAWACTGMPILSLAFLGLSALGILMEPAVVCASALLTGVGLLGAWPLLRALPSARVREPALVGWERWLRIVSLVALVTSCLALGLLALLPSVFYDDLVYHVGLPRQALLTGSWPALPNFCYAFLPAGWGMSYVLPLSLGGGSGPQLMNVGALALLAGTCLRLASRGGGRAAASAATALLLICPTFGWLAPFAGNDLFVALALSTAVEHLLASEGRRAATTGLLAGAAWSAKYTALPAIAGIGMALALLAGRERRARGARALVTMGVVVVLFGGAWNLRAWHLTGNPVYPTLASVLGGRDWDERSMRALAAEQRHGSVGERGLLALPLSALELATGTGDMGPRPGAARVFMPLALVGLLLARRVRGATTLLLVATLAWLGWSSTSLLLRFALVMLVMLAPFAAAVLERAGAAFRDGSAARGATRVALVAAVAGYLAIACWTTVGSVAAFMHLEGERFHDLRDLRRDFLVRRIAMAHAGREMASRLPADATILLVGDGRLALMPRRTLASSFVDAPGLLDAVRESSSVADLDARLVARGVTHVVVNLPELQRATDEYGFLERFTPRERELFLAWLQDGLTPRGRWGGIILGEPRMPAPVDEGPR